MARTDDEEKQEAYMQVIEMAIEKGSSLELIKTINTQDIPGEVPNMGCRRWQDWVMIGKVGWTVL
jgi:hypothetical protein